jgi:hypothetical protein
MPFTHVVVDGSNIATEGRSIPSLAQLDEAVREFKSEYPNAEITVVVDATFGHRIDASERATFDDAVAHGEMVSPPAGAIGRGDAFLLRIADRSGATVLSNDSFQEFHGEYEWLFTKDRLIGGKPVPAVGWIFTPRTPVRGPKSRESMREARKSKVRVGSKEASRPMPVPKAPPPRPGSGTGKGRKAGLSEAIAAATEEVVSPEAPGSGRRRRKRGSGPPTEAVNDPLSFIQFIADHPLGSEVEGEVESFASHGAFVMVGQARCYLPLSAMGEPPPRSAREVLNRSERKTFVLQALDPQRRGIELALPGHAHVSGSPLPETVEAEISETPRAEVQGTKPARATVRKGRAKKAPAPVATTGAEVASAEDRVGSTKAGTRKAPARKAAPKTEAAMAAKTVPTRKAATKRTSAPPTPVEEAVKAAAGKSAKKSSAKKATVAKKATAAATATTGAKASRKAPAAKATRKAAGPKEEAPADGLKVPAGPARPTKRAAAAKAASKATGPSVQKASARQEAAKKTATKKKSADKTTAGKTPAKKSSAKATARSGAGQTKGGTAANKTVAAKTPAKSPAAKKSVARKTSAKRLGAGPKSPPRA